MTSIGITLSKKINIICKLKEQFNFDKYYSKIYHDLQINVSNIPNI